MSQLASGKTTASNVELFGTLSTHFDDGLKMSNFKKSGQIAQFYRFLHRFDGFFHFSKFDSSSKSAQKTTNYAPFEAAIFRDESLDVKILLREITR